jgi:hypothetical protein
MVPGEGVLNRGMVKMTSMRVTPVVAGVAVAAHPESC